MTPRRLMGAGLGALAVLVAVLTLTGGSDRYVVHLRLDNAGGLRNGSDVVSGGVRIGDVRLHLDHADRVIADLRIERSHAPLGRDATAAISAANFLGRKRVELVPGHRADAAPDGFTIPPARVTTSTDLDQVLDVLDADTRTRLSVLIDEAGTALTGRRADFSALLQSLPHSEVKARQLLGEMVADTHTLRDTLAGSDRVVARVTAQRQALTRMVDVLGQAAAPVARQRAQLRATLARAPGTLRTLQAFLGDLRRTTVPLGPAARAITAAAPQLSATLAQVDPFRRAADPALRSAVDVAPRLTALAAGATPVLRRAAPVAADLSTLSRSAVPVSDTLDHSVDNLLAIVQNWSRAIQFRDGLSHVFRGEALFSPETFRSLVERLGLHLDGGRRARRPSHPAAPAAKAPARPDVLTPKAPAVPALKLPKVPGLPTITLPDVGATTKQVQQVIGALTGQTPRDGDAAAGLLDYLLGH